MACDDVLLADETVEHRVKGNDSYQRVAKVWLASCWIV